MRCLFLVKRFWPACGGVEKYITELARAVVARGHRVTVVAGAHSPDLPAREDLAGVAIHRFPALRSPWRCLRELSRLRSLFREADVIHVSDVEMLEYFGRMLGWRVAPRRLFLTIHGMSCIHPVPRAECARARRACRVVDGVIADGEFISRWLGITPDAVVLQGLRPEPAGIPQCAEPDEPSAVHVGRLEPDTGVSLYLDALHLLAAQDRLVLPLHVYGDGTQRAALQRQAEAQKLRVTFHGPAPDAQERIAEHTLAFVNGRMAIHEALARRRAVIAAYTNPIRADYVRAESFSPCIATGGSGEEIAAHVRRLIADAAARRDLVERGWRYVRELSWTRTADAYLNFWSTRAPARTRPTAWFARLRLAWKLWHEAGARSAPEPAESVHQRAPQLAPVVDG